MSCELPRILHGAAFAVDLRISDIPYGFFHSLVEEDLPLAEAIAVIE